MLFTQLILLTFACLANATHWQNHAHHHGHGFASMSVSLLALSLQALGAADIVIASRDQYDEQDDCDAEDKSADSGDVVVGSPGSNAGSGGVPASLLSSSTSASASPSSSAVSNDGVGQSSSSTAPAPASTTSSPSTPLKSGSGAAVGGQKDALHVVGAKDDINVVVQALESSSLSSSTAPAASSTSSTSPAGSGGSMGGSFTASFTEYGSNDQGGSGNCNTASAACGFYNNPGYNAAISQAVFGVGPGAGPGPACGLCYKLMPDSPTATSIVVKVNNLCPVDGNALCAQPQGVDVNFDLCKDDGAAAGLFGGAGPFQVNGTATQVDCGGWSGSADIKS